MLGIVADGRRPSAPCACPPPPTPSPGESFPVVFPPLLFFPSPFFHSFFLRARDGATSVNPLIALGGGVLGKVHSTEENKVRSARSKFPQLRNSSSLLSPNCYRPILPHAASVKLLHRERAIIRGGLFLCGCWSSFSDLSRERGRSSDVVMRSSFVIQSGHGSSPASHVQKHSSDRLTE